MYFTDDSLLPENQAPLMIVAAPYGPLWMPEDCMPEQKLPITWEEQVQAAVPRSRERRTQGPYNSSVRRIALCARTSPAKCGNLASHQTTKITSSSG
jgi:hypothetical protein